MCEFAGKGLWIWTDNDPFFGQANAILEKFHLEMKCDTPGAKILTLSDDTHDPPTGKFKRHVITTGIKQLYEGVTISYLDSLPKHKQGFFVFVLEGGQVACVEKAREKGRDKLRGKKWEKEKRRANTIVCCFCSVRGVSFVALQGIGSVHGWSSSGRISGQ